MKTIISSEDMDLTPSMRVHISERLCEGVLKHIPKDMRHDVATCDVIVKKHPRFGFEVSFSMILPENHKIYADSHEDDFTKALTSVREKVIKQVEKYKEKNFSK